MVKVGISNHLSVRRHLSWLFSLRTLCFRSRHRFMSDFGRLINLLQSLKDFIPILEGVLDPSHVFTFYHGRYRILAASSSTAVNSDVDVS
jgi:hypothetical protein